MVMMLATVLQPAVDGTAHSRILALQARLFLSALDRFETPLRKKVPAKKKGRDIEEIREVEEDSYQELDLDPSADEGEGEDPKDRNEGEDPKDPNNISRPLWLARCNFLCLLNLPDAIRKFGSPRNYFEGKYLGERYVQDVKNACLRCSP
jgi:hypothetical protein